MKVMLFISQPMRNKTDDEIREHQMELFSAYARKYPDRELQLVNPFMGTPDKEVMQDMLGHTDVEMLGESISQMSYADVVIFDKDWGKYPGCRIEHKVCTYYNIPMEYVR